MKQAIKIFLSYAKEDIDIVSKLYRRLKEKGYEPWLDIKNLLPGQRWEQEIPKAIKTSDFVLVFFSKTSISKRGYVQKEFKLTLEVLDTIPEGQIFVIPVRLNPCAIPKRFQTVQYCDLFEPDGFDKILQALPKGIHRIDSEKFTEEPIPHHGTPSLRLRSRPIYISKDEVKLMVQEYGFYDCNLNVVGRGVEHSYEIIRRHTDKLVVDHTTGLIWQPSGSEYYMLLYDIKEYIQELNEKEFGSFNDWRLPTLEEAMSLMEADKNIEGLHLHPCFSREQPFIFSADQRRPGGYWFVDYKQGAAFWASGTIPGGFGRACRSV